MDRAHRISIIPRGNALGYTLHLPDEDRNLKTREELLDEMTSCSAAAPPSRSSSAASPRARPATSSGWPTISRAMIHEWAMGTSVSALQLASEGGAVSDRTRELRDAEQQHLADEAMRRAARLLTAHRELLDALAAALLHQEVLERADIDRIMAGVDRPTDAAGAELRVAAAQREA